jgi:hypothetical protein
MQKSRQPGNMVGMSVRDENRSESPETPPRLTPGNLRRLATVEERQVPVNPDEKAGEPAIWQRLHPTRSQQHGVNHSGRSGTLEAGMAQA